MFVEQRVELRQCVAGFAVEREERAGTALPKRGKAGRAVIVAERFEVQSSMDGDGSRSAGVIERA